MQNAFPAFWVFRNAQGDWTWQFADHEGEFAARSDKTYFTQAECVEALRALTVTSNIAVFSTFDDLEAELPSSPQLPTHTSADEPADASEPLDLSRFKLTSGARTTWDSQPVADPDGSPTNGSDPISLKDVRMRMGPAKATKSE